MYSVGGGREEGEREVGRGRESEGRRERVGGEGEGWEGEEREGGEGGEGEGWEGGWEGREHNRGRLTRPSMNAYPGSLGRLRDG